MTLLGAWLLAQPESPPALREGVAGLLERAGFEIAGQAGDATDLLRLARAQRPDLAIVDIRMPPRLETDDSTRRG